MSKTELKIGEISKPRFEFRTFGQDFTEAAYRMSRLSTPVPEKVWQRESSEIYIMSTSNDGNNTKIRDGLMDIKTFVQEIDGLEQWNPLMKGEFPMPAETLNKEVFPAFQADMANVEEDVSLEQFLALVDKNPKLQAVRVHKSRQGYMVNGTLCEVGTVLINGARLMTINSESTDLEDIHKTLNDVGLVGNENINYLQAIKRVIGMIDKPFAN